jgi:hypothetical protein
MLLAMLVWVWIGGIDYMMKNHPDYKGDDFLHWESSESIVKLPPNKTINVKIKVKEVKKHKPKFNNED